MGDRTAAFFFRLAEEERPQLGAGAGVEICCLFFWLLSDTGRLGVFSLLCSDGTTVFLDAIFLTVMERLTPTRGCAILLSPFTLAGGGELNRGDRLLCEPLRFLDSAIMFRGVPSFMPAPFAVKYSILAIPRE